MSLLSLLNPSDPNPVRKTLIDAVDSPFVLVGDHAGAAIPAALDDLGLSAEDRARHIAVDIGTEALGQLLSRLLAAPFISQAYSRLVVDCNRRPEAPDWIAEESDGSQVPGNREMGEAEREARRLEVFEPYHRAIGGALDARVRGDPILVSLHSFTPRLGGQSRAWDIGVLHNGRRDEFARAVLARLEARGDRKVGDNQPYRMDQTDYTVPHHAWPRDLRYIEIEVRQDLLLDDAGIAAAANILAEALAASLPTQ